MARESPPARFIGLRRGTASYFIPRDWSADAGFIHTEISAACFRVRHHGQSKKYKKEGRDALHSSSRSSLHPSYAPQIVVMAPQWKNVNTIIENRLFLGNIIAARATRSLSDNRITHIVSVCNDPIPAEVPESGLQHFRVPVEDVDYADLLIHLPSAVQFIAQSLQSGGVVLVHCYQGLSRSAAVVTAYFMWARRWNVTTAMNFVRQSREQIWINPGFHEQLVLFELCRYNPSPVDGIYVQWRRQLDQRLRQMGLM